MCVCGGGGGGAVSSSTAVLSDSVLTSTPFIGLLCLLRMHTNNSCVGDI